MPSPFTDLVSTYYNVRGQIDATEEREYQKSLRPLREQQLKQGVTSQALQIEAQKSTAEEFKYQKSRRSFNEQQQQNTLTSQALDIDAKQFAADVTRPIQQRILEDQATVAKAHAYSATNTQQDEEARRKAQQSNIENSMKFLETDKDAKAWTDMFTKDMTLPANQKKYLTDYYVPRMKVERTHAAIMDTASKHLEFDALQTLAGELTTLKNTGNFDAYNTRASTYLKSSPNFIAEQTEKQNRATGIKDATSAMQNVLIVQAKLDAGSAKPIELVNTIEKYYKEGNGDYALLPPAVANSLRAYTTAGSAVTSRVSKLHGAALHKHATDLIDKGDTASAEAFITNPANRPFFSAEEYRSLLTTVRATSQVMIDTRIADAGNIENFKANAPSSLKELFKQGLVDESKLQAWIAKNPKNNLFDKDDSDAIRSVMLVGNMMNATNSISETTKAANADQDINSPSNVVYGASEVTLPAISQEAKGAFNRNEVSIKGAIYRMGNPHRLPGGTIVYPAKDLKTALAVKFQGTGSAWLAEVTLDQSSGATREAKLDSTARQVNVIDLMPSVVSHKSLLEMLRMTSKNVANTRGTTVDTFAGEDINKVAVGPGSIGGLQVRTAGFLGSLEKRVVAAGKSNDNELNRKLASQLYLLNLHADQSAAGSAVFTEPAEATPVGGGADISAKDVLPIKEFNIPTIPEVK